MPMYRMVMLWLVLMITVPAFASPFDSPAAPVLGVHNAIDISAISENIVIGDNLHYLEDANKQLSINDITDASISKQWQKSDQVAPSFGITNSAYWFYADLENTSPAPVSTILQIENPLLDEVILYVTNGDKVLNSYTVGLKHPFSQRPIASPLFAFPIDMSGGSKLRIYFNAHTLSDGLRVPTRLWQPQQWYLSISRDHVVHGVYFGIIIGLLLYNLFLYAVVKERVYLYYSLFQLSFVCFQLGISGYGQQFVWSTYTGVNTHLSYLFSGFVGFFLCYFSYKLIAAESFSHTVKKAWLILAWLFAAGLAITPIISDALYIGMLFQSGVVALMAISFCATSILYWKHSLVVRIWAAALLCFVGGTALYVAAANGVIETNFFFEHAMQIGSALEAIILSLLLGYRIRREQDEKRMLMSSTKSVREAAREKSRLLAEACHDLRQPLHALSLFVDVLRDDNSQTQRETLFPRIDAAMEAMQKLFDTLLDVSRLDANSIVPEYSHFDIDALIQTLANEYRPAAQAKGLQLKTRARNIIVMSDRLLVERVLRNLISNAIRYTDVGKVLITCRQYKSRVLIQVWDTGIGIPEEQCDEIFLEFKQLHQPTHNRNEGFGLGLSVVQKICGLLTLPLTLRSTPGKGSVFSITLPLGDEGSVANEQECDRSQVLTLEGLKLLVIDDDSEVLSAMRALLEKWQCHVITACSLDEAIQAMQQQNFVPSMI